MDFHFLVMEKSWKINVEKEGTLTAENDKRMDGQGLHMFVSNVAPHFINLTLNNRCSGGRRLFLFICVCMYVCMYVCMNLRMINPPKR